MLRRLYVNNYRCLVAFEVNFEPYAVLCGPNGGGKSSLFDVLTLIRDLAVGDAVLGGDGPRDIRNLQFTNWRETTTQEFEIGIQAGGMEFLYLLHLEQVTPDHKPRIVRERAACGGRELFERDLEGVRLFKSSGDQRSFPLDWRQAALGAIQPAADRREIETLRQALTQLLILRPSPREMEPESRGEANRPEMSLSNLISWYRSLSQEQEWTDSLRSSLQDVWPDFRSFRLQNVGLHAKALQLRFAGGREPEGGDLFLEQLSDGERALVGLYMVRAALETGAARSVFIDEPDNYVGLPELQPWVLSIAELLDSEHQAVLISHHPEVLALAGASALYLWRDNHTSPSRIGPLAIPRGLTPGEAVARGWVHA